MANSAKKSTRSSASSKKSSGSSRRASSSRRSTQTAAARAAALDPNELRAEQAQRDALERAKSVDTDKAGTVHGYAVYDHDAQQIAMFFRNGDEKQQKQDAAGHMGSLLGRTGDAPERKLSIVKLVEVGA